MKKTSIKYSLTIVLTILLFSFSNLHDFFISITSIDYNNDSNKLEVSCQFTTHDIEKAIISAHKIDLNLCEPNEYPKADSVLFEYIKSNFNLRSIATISYNFVGKEVNLDETLWVYIESSKVSKPDKLEIENTFLVDDFESQSNITHVNFGKKQQSFSFNRLHKVNTYTVK